MKNRQLTTAPMQFPLPVEEQVRLRNALITAGCRFTRQREAVYSFLRSVHTHPTAEEVYHAVRGTIPNISLATVYKSLEALVGSRLAQKLSFGDGPARYDCRTDHHFHVHCTRTGQVRDVPSTPDGAFLQNLAPELLIQLQTMGFQVTDYRLELLGHFTDSATADEPAP